MKTVLLMRHGKSDWGADFDSDHERPLAPRGLRAAESMGGFLTSIGEIPDRLIASSAIRARDTARLAAQAGGWSCSLSLAENLYGATVDTVLQLIRQQPDSISRLLLVGHQPTLSEVVIELSGANTRFPTAAAARIDLPIESWADAGPGQGVMVWFLGPRLLDRCGLGKT